MQITLDPGNAIAESDEGNNLAIATLHLSEAGSVALTLSADSPSAAPGTAFGGHVGIVGSTGFVGELALRVLDAEGTTVTDLFREPVGPLRFATPWSRRWSWLPLAGLLADHYLLEARFYGVDGTLVQSRTLPLRLEAQNELRLHLQPSVPTIQIGESLGIQFGLDYLSGNHVIADAQLRLTVVDAAGAESLLWQGSAGTLMPGYSQRRTAIWDTAGHALGDARLRLQLQTSDILQTIERDVSILHAPPSVRLSGSLALAPKPRVVLGEPAPRLTYRVENTGEVALADVQTRVTLRDEGGGEVLSGTGAQDLLMPGQSLHGDLPLDSLPQQPQGYFSTLQARVADGPWQNLAQLGFSAVDGLAPHITVLLPDPGIPHRSPLVLAVDIVDQHSHVAVAQYRMDGSAWRPLGAQGSRFETVLDGLADGQHEIVIRAEDAWGNERIGAPWRFVADSTPPQIVIEGVHDGQTSRLPLPPQVSVVDAHPDQLSIWLNDERFSSGDSIHADGVYTLTALAVDAAGNRTDRELTFTLDTIAPPVAIVDPLDGIVVPAASITVRVQTEAQAQVTLSTDAWQATRMADAQGDAVFDAVPLAVGENLISAVAQDAAGNASQPARITVQRHVSGDGLVGSVLPSAAEVARGAMLDASATLSNGAAQDHVALPVRLRVLAASGVLDARIEDVALESGGNASQPFAFDTATWMLGSVTLELSVFLDEAWQVLDSATVAIVDRSPPVLTPLSPAHGAVLRAPVTLLALADDDDALASIAASLDGGPWLPLAAMESGQWQGTVSPADGPHQVRFRAIDRAGNETISSPTTFTVDTTPPQIVVTGVADGGLYGVPVQADVAVLDANPASLILTLNGAPYVSGTHIDTSGTYTLEAQAEDAVGLTAVRVLTFALDLEQPFVSIDAPADGVILMTASTPVAGTTRPFASVVVAGELSTHTVAADADGQYAVGAVQLAEGANVLRAVATDRLGRVSQEAAITVYRSTTALGLDGQLSAMPAPLPVEATLDLAYRVDEQLGMVRTALPLRLRVQRVGGKVTVFEQISTVDLAASAHVEGAVAAASNSWNLGVHVAELAVQVEGVWHTLAASSVDVVDAMPPQVAFAEPAVDSYHPGAVAMAILASDAHSAIVAVEARVGAGAWVALSQTKPGQPWVGSLMSPGDGPAILQARATDGAGNASAVVQRPIVFDATPPDITISGVVDGELRNTPVTPVITVEDASPVHATITLNGQPWTSGTPVTADGEHHLRAIGVDAAGNNAKASVRFTIDTLPPVVVLTSPVDGSVLRSPSVDVTGSTEAHASIELLAADKHYIAQADASGAFIVPRVMLMLGSNEIAAHAMDAAGNAGEPVRITVQRRGEPLLRGELDVPAMHDRVRTLTISVVLHNEADEAITALPSKVVARLANGQSITLDARQQTLESRASASYVLQASTQQWPLGNAVIQLLATPDPANPGLDIQLATATVAVTERAMPPATPIPSMDLRWLLLLCSLLAITAASRVLHRGNNPC